MKVANIQGNACLILDQHLACNIADESNGQFGPTMPDLFTQWEAFSQWAASHTPSITFEWNESELEAVSPRPSQVFAIGLNYDEHSKETGIGINHEFPPVFPKWASSIANPNGTVSVPEDSHIDWEVELVAIIGQRASNVTRENAMEYVAGFAVGQDFSDRQLQFIGDAPQFGLAKSCAGFAPVGPYIVTPNELANMGEAAITCEVDGVVKQAGTLNQMIFPVADILAILSKIVTLNPGDLVFTGTPSGVGYARKPQEFLQPGSCIVSTIEGIGSIQQQVVSR
ncbi:fumarylacetoacetate hydrolase family protein [Halomonas sp. AOP43-A1-21]|uniref:Fumarylacetoacetate hydrolase family protein n=1 Tax=Halomonas colorata TaxID=2742615 RepID=A0ABR9FWK6_9GAMM|nr:fumarylacetoacetate hydrolase family protein [Halomonas colorata]MBE0463033.1 fumarylacetoacetate hydrolase family protein [Halomonas colorata]